MGSIVRSQVVGIALCLCASACSDDGTAAEGGGSGSEGGDASATASATGGNTTTGASTMTTGETGSCPIGTQGCPCTDGGFCNGGLVCIDELCLDPGPTSGVDGSSSADEGSTSGVGTATTEDGTASGVSASSDGEGGSSGTTGEPAMLDDWTKRRPVFIDNSLDEALVDHEVLIDIGWDGDWSPTLADIRFTDEAGAILLPHYVESFTAPVAAYAWVRVPDVPANDTATIYVWYGNAGAASTSNPEDTFHFYDGFDGNDIDGATWTAGGNYVVENGHLDITSGAVYSLAPIAFGAGWMVEGRMQWLQENNQIAQSAIQFHEAQGAVGMGMGLVSLAHPALQCVAADDDINIGNAMVGGPAVFNTYSYLGVAVSDALVRCSNRDSASGAVQTFNDPVTGDFYVILGHIWGSVGGGMDTNDIRLDHVWVRRFVPTAPMTFVGAEEDV